MEEKQTIFLIKKYENIVSSIPSFFMHDPLQKKKKNFLFTVGLVLHYIVSERK